MRIVSINVNGIRAAQRKGFFDWLPRQKADVFCLQEVRAQAEQIADAVYWPKGYHTYHEYAERKGYSGVALVSRHEPDDVRYGFGSAEFDAEGRYIEARFGKLSVVSVYMPSGSSKDERQQAKFRFMEEFTEHLKAIRASKRDYILCGDWNIAHKEIDLKNWKGNLKNSGFLPEERAWLDEVFGSHGFVDAFRRVNPIRISTHGGRTGAGRGITMSDGALTTRLSRHHCRTRWPTHPYTSASVIRTMPR